MISKQKLLQWIEDKRHSFTGPYDTKDDEMYCKGAKRVLARLEQVIELGEFEEEGSNPSSPSTASHTPADHQQCS
ncbi:hypothetical protein J2736_006731 [Paenibacillus qinlingensis]|uniref:Uncharacterized protein n=1 Tax=Paenibacillus qinlingensis TaxID=1837343 RepID=A0ABU1P7D2_9BACL|nr:hypothetical protein [Paenibacillus qinlingensis]